MGSGYFNVQKKEVLVMESETKEFVQLVRLYAVKERELSYGKKELNDSAKVVELSRQILKIRTGSIFWQLLWMPEPSRLL